MKNWAIVVILIVACICFFLAVWDSTSKIRKLQAEYDSLKSQSEQIQHEQQAIIDHANDTIAIKDGEIDSLNTVIQAKETENAHLSNQLDELQNTEPSYPDMEAHPLVINLRGQIKTLTSMYSLAREEINKKDMVIESWTVKYNLQVQISKAWETKYNTEHALRVSSEELAKAIKSSKSSLTKTITYVAVAVVAVSVVGLLK